MSKILLFFLFIFNNSLSLYISNIIELPNEMILNIFKKVLKNYIKDNKNIFDFYKKINKKNIKKDIDSLILVCKKFNLFKIDIIKLFKKLKNKRIEYLKSKIKKNINKEFLDLELLRILNLDNISKKNIKYAIELIIAGADINIVNKNNRNLLIIATLENYQVLVKLLIDLKININHQDNRKNTALIYSIYHDRKKITKMLIKSNADLTIKNSYNQSTVFLAAHCSDKKTLRLLFNYYINLKTQDEEDFNLLSFAYFNPDSRCIIF